MEITNQMVEGAYKIAKRVYEGDVTRNNGTFEIYKVTNMSLGSANGYITDFLAMVNGQRYTRTLNTYATRYYLENIKSDYGMAVFAKALEAVTKHVKYYNALGHGNLNSIQIIVDEMRE